MSKPRAIIMDLDGTLCDGREFLHLGDHAYHEAAVTVAPVNPTMKAVCRAATDDGALVVILTGRSVVWQPGGEQWLATNGVPYHKFFSRPRGDYRRNAEVKRGFVRLLRRSLDIDIAYDDDPRNIRMFEGFGIDAIEVGNFDWRLA